MTEEYRFSGYKIKDVDRIFADHEEDIGSVTDILNFIEVPLRGAVWALLEKGIMPYSHSANHTNQLAYIAISPCALSPDNLETAGTFFGYRGLPGVMVAMIYPITADDYLTVVGGYFVRMADRFHDQWEFIKGFE